MDEQTKDPDVLNVLVLERIDRTKNMARYYALSVEPTLFAESSLVPLGPDRRRRANTNRPSCFPAARADCAQHMARTQAAPRLPTPRLIAALSRKQTGGFG
jgi:predicted DNA-binding WGR domain protein